MDSSQASTGSSDDDKDAHIHVDHSPMRPKHAHAMIHRNRNVKRKREHMEQDKRQVQTALDVIVVSDGKTVGDVLLGSIPSDPTTASLPGFGALTLSSFIPAAATDAASTTPAAASASTRSNGSSSPPAPTAAASPSSLTPAMTGLNATTSTLDTSSHSSMAYNVGMATSYNSTSSASATTYLNTTSASSTMTDMSLSSSSNFTSFATSTSSFASSSSSPSSTSASSTGGGIIGGGGSAPTNAGSQPSAVVSPSNNTPSNAGPIAGGVVGGVAGAALFAVLLFLLLRWYRQRQARGQRLLGSPGDEEGTSARGAPTGPSSPAMTQRSSFAPIAAAINRFRPESTQTAASASTAAAPSERGFQKISGRKLTNVLQSGGDGYGEPAAASGSLQPPPAAHAANRERDFAGFTFFRDSNSHRGSDPNPQQQNDPAEVSAAAMSSRSMQPAQSESSMAAQDPRSNRQSSIYDAPSTGNPFSTHHDRALAAFSTSPGSESSDGFRSPTPDINETLTVHQGPVRTPVIGGVSPPTPPVPPRRPGHGIDGLGRSRPSWDGSRHSRFSEAI